jgi:hypothetical protein
LDVDGNSNENLIPLQSVFFHGVAHLPLTFRPSRIKLER